MITVRPSQERGMANFGWLDSRHSFSFGQYYDPNYVGFGTLRVINEDKVTPGAGFPTHPHHNMEIITYIIDGALEHKDSMGNGSIIRPGDVQRMTAGTGIKHSEFNPSQTDPVHLLQIWIIPDTEGLTPSYEQKHFLPTEKEGKLCLIASQDGKEGSVTIHQAVDLYTTQLKEGQTVQSSLKEGRSAWVQVVKGSVQLIDRQLIAGDGAAIMQMAEITLTGLSELAEVLLFDLPEPISV
ncbi:pirin family protein [Crocosphaera sp. XPORK-15E]|uniref:pirin family protein n=1 Tax=Crocosphaera sp. XPORK-15E TaxID=3110247 RepID=UPI002B1F53B3|nr:pirin family protein [Crocosphaera sp. XPORK-15E]MEA5533157.1 pirin family protein [Crocosphaera sp. XPORK-15E]